MLNDRFMQKIAALPSTQAITEFATDNAGSIGTVAGSAIAGALIEKILTKKFGWKGALAGAGAGLVGVGAYKGIKSYGDNQYLAGRAAGSEEAGTRAGYYELMDQLRKDEEMKQWQWQHDNSPEAKARAAFREKVVDTSDLVGNENYPTGKYKNESAQQPPASTHFSSNDLVPAKSAVPAGRSPRSDSFDLLNGLSEEDKATLIQSLTAQ